MIRIILLIGIIYLAGSSESYSQEKTDLKAQIEAKETALADAATGSRQISNTLRTELKELYSEFQLQLKRELEIIKDEELLLKKREELEVVNQKIQNYSRQK